MKGLARWAILVLIVPAIPFTARQADASAPTFVREREVLVVWSGQTLRRMAPGFDMVFADLYWLRTVQYFGSQRAFAAEARFDLLRPLIEITTELDPRMEVAYRYGATFLAEPYPTGAGTPEDAFAVLRLGQARNPGAWRLWQFEGLFRYFFTHDSVRAADTIGKGARLPGAAPWMHTLEAVMRTRAGDRASARAIWQQIYLSEEEFMRENAKVHLLHLEALDRMDALRAGLAEYERAHGSRPGSLRELASAGLARAPLVDPTDVAFAYDPATGQVSLADTSQLRQLER